MKSETQAANDPLTREANERLQDVRPTHPALARVHDTLVGRNDSDEITSYDRMHHRHNRS